MTDILEALKPETLHSVAEVVALLEHPGGGDIFETPVENVLTESAQGNELVTTEVVTELLTEGVQGPPGPPGSGTGGGIEQSTYVDASRPVAYVGYSSRIVRLDYATWPPVETTATTTNVHADWPNRASLTYT